MNANRYSKLTKYLPALLITATLTLSYIETPKAVTAGTCVAATSCGPQPIQFVPGEWITVELTNLTARTIEVQQLYATDPLFVNPGEVISFLWSGNTEPNFSVIFWDSFGDALKVNLFKPEAKKLRIEVRRGGQIPGDHSVYLRDDGRIDIL